MHFRKILSCQFYGLSSTKPSFPYKFGGIDPKKSPIRQSSPTDSKTLNLLAEQTFGSQFLPSLKQTYIEILSALKDKHSAYLQKISSGLQVNKIKYPQHMQLLHADAKVQVDIVGMMLVMGIGFQRERNFEYVVPAVVNPLANYMPIYQGNSNTIFNQTTKPNLLILLTKFTSSAKLTESRSPLSSLNPFSSPEHHLIQYQLQTKSNQSNSTRILTSSRPIPKQDVASASQLLRRIIGEGEGEFLGPERKGDQFRVGGIDQGIGSMFQVRGR